MSRLWMWSAGLCLAALVAASPVSAGEKASKSTCGSHGTTIDFLDTPKEASEQAKKEGKLVFVLHVSGNFENPRFT